MELYHSSMEKIEKIHNHGLFNEFLFFSSTYDAHGGTHVISIDVDDDSIVTPYNMFYACEYEDGDQERLDIIINEVMKECNCDYELATDLLAAQTYVTRHSHFENLDGFKRGDLGWYIQAQIAQCAKAIGFNSVEIHDEHGTSYMINMISRDFVHC